MSWVGLVLLLLQGELMSLPEDPMVGARLFLDKGCVKCHSLGEEAVRIGPDLGRIELRGSLLDLGGTLWNHAPMMSEKMKELKIPRPEFTVAEMTNLIAFLTAYRFYVSEVGRPANPTLGERIFAEKGCARCHSLSNGWEKPGPSLGRYRGRYTPIEMAGAMWNHGPEMAKVMEIEAVAWPRFRGEEMRDLLAFLRAGATPNAEKVYLEPGNPRRGAGVFQAKGCSRCHSIRGRGGRVGPDLGRRRPELVRSVASVAGLLWNHGLPMWAKLGQAGLSQPELSGQEMADIIAYLYFVNYLDAPGRPERGRELFSRKQCQTCHEPSGKRDRVGPDLTRASSLSDPISLVTAMWNHAPKMEEALRRLQLSWPRLERGEPADLAAYLAEARESRARESRTR